METPAGSSNNFTLPTNLTCEDSYVNPSWLHTVIPASIYTISTLGIPLNLLVLLVFLLHKKARTVTEIYLSNMAAANLFLAVFWPFWGKYISNEHIWTFGGPMCKIVGLLILMNYHCSVYFLVLVSIDRFLVLAHPLSPHKLRRHKYAKVSCVAVWCFGFLLNIPTLVCRQTVELDPLPHNKTASYDLVEYECDWNCLLKPYLVSDIVQAVVVFIIPLLIISFCTVKILQALKGRPKLGVKRSKGQRKMTIIALVVLFVFITCWLPFHMQKIVELAMRVELIEETCKLVRVINMCKHIFASFGFFNSVLNTVLYVIVMKHFHKKLRGVLSGCGSQFAPATTGCVARVFRHR